jgi:hypothetical protein
MGFTQSSGQLRALHMHTRGTNTIEKTKLAICKNNAATMVILASAIGKLG